jgi:hypothetical protein
MLILRRGRRATRLEMEAQGMGRIECMTAWGQRVALMFAWMRGKAGNLHREDVFTLSGRARTRPGMRRMET